jgi:hypothetical protein
MRHRRLPCGDGFHPFHAAKQAAGAGTHGAAALVAVVADTRDEVVRIGDRQKELVEASRIAFARVTLKRRHEACGEVVRTRRVAKPQ